MITHFFGIEISETSTSSDIFPFCEYNRRFPKRSRCLNSAPCWLVRDHRDLHITLWWWSAILSHHPRRRTVIGNNGLNTPYHPILSDWWTIIRRAEVQRNIHITYNCQYQFTHSHVIPKLLNTIVIRISGTTTSFHVSPAKNNKRWRPLKRLRFVASSLDMRNIHPNAHAIR